MIGNFIGDFVKGKQFELYEEQIRKGILLHREIDRYTDSHKVVKQSKKRLQPTYRHYSPVIVDVFYDHFLSANWDKYSERSLLTYTKGFYSLTEKFKTIIPERAIYMLKYMKAGNWLYNYQFVEGIDQALTGMSKRTKFDSGMENASIDLQKEYDAFKSEFELFFPDLVAHANKYLIHNL